MVAIKDFGMPSCCDNCDIFDWVAGACHITNTRCEEPFDSKNDDCPLIEIEHQESIEALEQEPKMGQWIEHFDESGKWYECDQCHTDWGGPVNYCPNCGCAMGVDKR